MKDLFKQYLSDLYQTVPLELYLGLFAVFIIGLVAAIITKGVNEGKRFIIVLLLIEYIVLLFCSMIIFRPPHILAGQNFYPLWSYKSIIEGHVELIPEVLMNVVVFVPIGYLLGVVFSKNRFWLTLLCGCIVSITIEVTQLFLKRGFTEFDDVIHNVFGCVLGCVLYSLLRKGYEELSIRFLAVL